MLHSFCNHDSHTSLSYFFFFNDTATTEIYTLSLHDALPIYPNEPPDPGSAAPSSLQTMPSHATIARATTQPSIACGPDRKSTCLNSSHLVISYAVFCLKKKNNRRRRGRRVPTDYAVRRV